ncbi:branched-chain amino acid ABC transporter permease [Fundidesulfovibrio agrisoli]|uniref:branched-chain amino acid ABC transporter permease n=1 Tax=Fundidesulfovibrio agrisoli TaxID=2922717 RepID=UPI001FAD0D7B|nr:branched-chain amino acid ABC transporter permease [Fundidesulfovibrio agrisoli]
MLETVIQQALNALQLGSYYSLIALGYCLVYGVLLLINFAHGDIFMVGAYIAFFAATYIMGQHALIPPNSPIMVKLVFAGFFALIVTAAVSFAIKKKPQAPGRKNYSYPAILGGIFITVTAAIYYWGQGMKLETGADKILVFAVTMPLTMILTSVVGVFIERVAYKPLRLKGANRLYVVITALMMGIILEYGNLSLLGTSRLSYPTLLPRVVFDVAGAKISITKLTAIAASFLMFALLQWIVTRTKLGMAMRAVSYDKFAVPLMGIPLDAVIVFTFFLGSSMAGMAGMLYAMNFPVLDPFMGALVGWKAFVAAVVGGIGDIRGAFVGGFLLAFLEVIVAAVFSSELRDLISFTILLGILTWKPTGLFGKPKTTKI